MKKKTQVIQETIKRQTDETRIPEAIRTEKNNRLIQVKNLQAALANIKLYISELSKMTDKIEQLENFDIDLLKRHYVDLELSQNYKNNILGRLSEVQKHYALANERYNKALEESHICFGCRNFRTEHILGKVCSYGWEDGDAPIPCDKILVCPEPTDKEVA
jgi:hypothetical protein